MSRSRPLPPWPWPAKDPGRAPSGAGAPLPFIRTDLAARARRWIIAAGMVAAASLVAQLIATSLHTDRLSMIFLAPVLVSAVTLGAEPALVAAGLAFAVYNFYIVEPRYTVQFATVEDVFVLAAFLAVALLTGGLAGRMRDEHARARANAASLTLLFEATREMAATEDEAALRDRLAITLGAACSGLGWVFADATLTPGKDQPRLPPADRETLARAIARTADDPERPEILKHGRWRVRPLTTDSMAFGVAVWRLPVVAKATGEELDRFTRALADVGAGALARARLSAHRAETETAARTERLRTALLSSVSHDFRTPLAAVTASASSLVEYGDQFDPATRRDLATTILEEGERLNRFVGNLLNMTKLESGALELSLAPTSVVEAAQDASNRLARRLGHRRLNVDGGDATLLAQADPVLLDSILVNLIENAIRFSPDGSEILIQTRRLGDRVQIDVADEGPGVSAADLSRLFDKFYRGSGADRSGGGMGLGLSICKGLAEAMGGAVALEARSDRRTGLRATLSLVAA